VIGRSTGQQISCRCLRGQRTSWKARRWASGRNGRSTRWHGVGAAIKIIPPVRFSRHENLQGVLITSCVARLVSEPIGVVPDLASYPFPTTVRLIIRRRLVATQRGSFGISNVGICLRKQIKNKLILVCSRQSGQMPFNNATADRHCFGCISSIYPYMSIINILVEMTVAAITSLPLV
jgi:hypothetical protein